jgi:peptidyl-tRNA hydrolase
VDDSEEQPELIGSAVEDFLRWASPVYPSGVPWAMQLAMDDDRRSRPTHLAVCAAAAAAVVTLLSDPRASQEDGEWHDRVQRWLSGPIRKVVRRGRGVRFEAVQELPGVLVERSGARVRAFVPSPIDEVPLALAKLQVGGTDLPERGEPAAPVPGGLTIVLTPLVAMTTGKAAAQSGHAAQLALAAMDSRARGAWQEAGWPIRVLMPGADQWRRMERSARVAVHDGGFTEVPAGTRTALALWLG